MLDADVVVVGSGPNGLVAAWRLARAGLRVLVLEAHPTRAGGAVGSEPATLPGFVHDVGAAFFTFGRLSPAFRAIDLEAHGVRWRAAPLESAHPAADGSCASIARGTGTPPSFGSPADTSRFAELARWHASIEPAFLDALLGPIPPLRPALRLLPFDLPRLARIFATSGRGLACRLFDGEAARRVLPGLALHVDVGPDDTFGAGLGYVLALSATTGGFAIPEGGAQRVTDALVRALEAQGGTLRLGEPVERIVVRDGRACAVRTVTGAELATRAVVADTSAASLLLELLGEAALPGRVVRAMRRFRQGWGTFKVDWALSGPVPWSHDDARRAAVVHAGDSLDDLARFTAEVRGGAIPTHPYLVVGQQSLADPTRAPDGRQTLWAYSRVPSTPPGGWTADAAARFADTVETRIEGLAPGFRSTVLGRRVVTPDDLERMDRNLVGGDLGGGSNDWTRQLVFRPVFPYFRYRMPVRGVYLGSSYAHPGAGVHGMCGWNAAGIAAADLGVTGGAAPTGPPARSPTVRRG